MRALIALALLARTFVYFEAERDYTRPGPLNRALIYRPRP